MNATNLKKHTPVPVSIKMDEFEISETDIKIDN